MEKKVGIHFDESVSWVITEKGREIFLREAKESLDKYNWYDLGNTESKIFFIILVKIIRKVDYGFREVELNGEMFCEDLSCEEILVLHRFFKIRQIELGEDKMESEEFKFFQNQSGLLLDIIHGQ